MQVHTQAAELSSCLQALLQPSPVWQSRTIAGLCTAGLSVCPQQLVRMLLQLLARTPAQWTLHHCTALLPLTLPRLALLLLLLPQH
jgi:hypothetical protein